MRKLHWIRVVTGGVLWSTVYDTLWGLAWFAFMRREWLDAAVGAHRPMPWTPEYWVMWIAITVPLGVAISAYSAGNPHAPLRKAIIASVGLWVLMTPAMIVLWRQDGFSARVITLDSTVDLLAILGAAFSAAWIHHRLGQDHLSG